MFHKVRGSEGAATGHRSVFWLDATSSRRRVSQSPSSRRSLAPSHPPLAVPLKWRHVQQTRYALGLFRHREAHCGHTLLSTREKEEEGGSFHTDIAAIYDYSFKGRWSTYLQRLFVSVHTPDIKTIINSGGLGNGPALWGLGPAGAIWLLAYNMS